MNKKLVITIFASFVILLYCVEAKKSFKSRSSSSARGSGRKTNYNPQPAPTSLSYPQPSAPKPAPKPTLFAWQEKPKPQTKPSSTGTGQSHSYPSSHTGLSGNNQPKQSPSYQDSVQRSSATQNLNGQQAAHPVPQQTNSQTGHSYPSSSGLSGNSGGTQQAGSSYPNQQKTSYPQQTGTGLSGSGAAPPPYPGHNNGPTYQGNNYGNNGPAYQGNNYGNSYHHPQGPPPPQYSNYGGYGGHHNNPGYGAPMSGYSPQMPGYFGNYGNKGFGGGGLSRGGSALTGVGIAGAGVGTLLTGLALWNLARSTGNHRHTVIYDNRGQPVAVAPSNSTEPVVDPILADLVNCTLTISNSNATEVLAIPCAIATSFTPDAEVKALENGKNTSDDTKCTVTIVNKSGREFETTIPCSVLLNTAAENNVTEPPPMPLNATENLNSTMMSDVQPNQVQPSSLNVSESIIDSVNQSSHYNCTLQPAEIRDPINPCYAITHNVTVLPLPTTEKTEIKDE